tara:strand:+ start:361 stop:552 length:192 start_codon:yes stop_codon:yes gene_type:complete
MNNLKNKKTNSLVDIYIIVFFFISVLFLESLKTLSELFSYGIFKKEILTTKSNLGFDVKIRIK